MINLSGGLTHDFSPTAIALDSGVNVSLRGNAADIVNISSNGAMFTIKSGAKLTLRGPTLKGKADNTASLVNVSGGAFFLRSGVITGNTASGQGGGVKVFGGSFTMSGGAITGNTANNGNSLHNAGGGVYVNSGSFIMSGGTISGNKAGALSDGAGGGVYVTALGNFEKIGSSSIIQNTLLTGTNGLNVAANVAGYGNKKRDTAAGPGVNLNTGSSDNWEE